MEQKVVITDSELTINEWLAKGWTISTVICQNVAVGGGGDSSLTKELKGKFCFIIQRVK